MPGTPIARRTLAVLLGLAALFAAFIAGRAPLWRAEAARPQDRTALYYVDPMHPSYRSDRPGKAPDCGMDLEPVYADVRPAAGAADKTIQLTPGQEQSIHLRTETLRRVNGSWLVRTVGRVVPEEDRTFRVSAGVDGWVRRVFADTTGSQVKKGRRLASFYGRDISAPQQGYLFALESYQRLLPGPASAEQKDLAARQLALARGDLELIGMGGEQIDALGRTRHETYEIDLTAPADGQILERNIDVGDRFTKGAILYRLADLSRVWVLADLFLRDVDRVASIAEAKIAVGGLPPMEGRVTRAPVDFGRDAVIGKLRLEVDNPHRLLVPGMFADVTLTVNAGPALTLDENAVLDAGSRSVVFVAFGGGRYEAREVETGWRRGGRIEIRSGLDEGEAVVTAGNFFLDSESRLRSAGPPRSPDPQVVDAVTDPSCGMTIDRRQAQTLARGGKTYYFCSPSCREKFRSKITGDPGRNRGVHD